MQYFLMTAVSVIATLFERKISQEVCKGNAKILHVKLSL